MNDELYEGRHLWTPHTDSYRERPEEGDASHEHVPRWLRARGNN